MSSSGMPVVYLPHGGGPWPYVDIRAFTAGEVSALSGFLEALPGRLGARPDALLVVSAHWEEAVPTLTTSPHPPMLYDYYGFPPESYQITWPAPGSPALAASAAELLQAAGFEPAANDTRGFDHGAFIPLKVMYPDAQLPTVQLSMLDSLDPDEHMAIGAALAPLRERNVLIIGSGMSYHDVRGIMTRHGRRVSETFDAWLQHAATAPAAERAGLLATWSKAPDARRAHPREDHLLPLMVIAGAAGDDRGTCIFSDLFGDARISAFRFG